MIRWLALACLLAGHRGGEIDLADAQDLAAELVHAGRLRPYVEWAGGEVEFRAKLAAAAARDNAAAEAMF